jgi:hypothetical protein
MKTDDPSVNTSSVDSGSRLVDEVVPASHAAYRVSEESELVRRRPPDHPSRPPTEHFGSHGVLTRSSVSAEMPLTRTFCALARIRTCNLLIRRESPNRPARSHGIPICRISAGHRWCLPRGTERDGTISDTMGPNCWLGCWLSLPRRHTSFQRHPVDRHPRERPDESERLR